MPRTTDRSTSASGRSSRFLRRAAGFAVGLATLAPLAPAVAQTDSTITYQGLLSESSQAYTGSADFRFRLWDAPAAGQQHGPTREVPGVAVEDGLFDVQLDFGPHAYTGGRWLEIEVRTPAWSGTGTPPPFTQLAPRQAVTHAPYAVQTRGIVVDSAKRVGVGSADVDMLRADLNIVGNDPAFTGHLAIVNSAYPSTANQADAYMTGWGNEFGTGAEGRLWVFGNAFGADRNVYLMNQLDAAIAMGTSGRTGDLVITAAGDVGIGVASPQARLDVDGWVRAEVVEITGGSDIAEPFDIVGADVRPGMVVCIDPERPGDLRLSDRAYDPTVAGVISGAGGVRPGVTLTQTGTEADGQHPVALTGRVWCYVDADAGGPVAPGDLLTTSSVPGHAMRAAADRSANGAILGKAMSSLPAGRGLVLVLVNLQ
ncbi:MAG: hypothetical protein ACF8R7_08220 [Phycisphaerales bacterium JB039]